MKVTRFTTILIVSSDDLYASFCTLIYTITPSITHTTVVSSDGVFYKAVFDAEAGGECVQEKSEKFIDSA